MKATFNIPTWMEPDDVARTMTAYLLGAAAFNVRSPRPVRHPEQWQLDDNNDYWLRIDGGQAELTCRYPGQSLTINLMMRLFRARYGMNQPIVQIERRRHTAKG